MLDRIEVVAKSGECGDLSKKIRKTVVERAMKGVLMVQLMGDGPRSACYGLGLV